MLSILNTASIRLSLHSASWCYQRTHIQPYSGENETHRIMCACRRAFRQRTLVSISRADLPCIYIKPYMCREAFISSLWLKLWNNLCSSICSVCMYLPGKFSFASRKYKSYLQFIIFPSRTTTNSYSPHVNSTTPKALPFRKYSDLLFWS